MKFSFILTIVLMLMLLNTNISVYAQYGYHDYDKNEISLYYGWISTVQAWEGEHLDRYGEFFNRVVMGPVAVTYRYHFSPKYAIGFSLLYENESGDWYVYNYQTSHIDLAGTFKRQVFTLAPELIVSKPERNSKLFHYYGYFGAGVSFLNGVNAYSDKYYLSNFYNGVNKLGNYQQLQNDKIEFAFQVCPAAFSFGNTFRIFTEFGFGYKGLINCGATLNF